MANSTPRKSKNHYRPLLIDGSSIVQEIYSSVAPPTGHFKSISRMDEKTKKISINAAYHCRESFSHYFTGKTKYFVFTVSKTKAKDFELMASGIAEVEQILKLGLNSRVVFEKTKESNSILVHISPWWKANVVRRQILTALMRVCLKKNALKNILEGKKVRYFSNTVLNEAFKRFLSGKTRIKNRIIKIKNPSYKYWGGSEFSNVSIEGSRGWVWTFSQPENLKILV